MTLREMTTEQLQARITALEAAVESLGRIVYNGMYRGFDSEWADGQIKGIVNPIARAAIEKARKE